MPSNKPRFVSHFPDKTVRVYDIFGDEVLEYSGRPYEEVQEAIESHAGKIGVLHTEIRDIPSE